VGGLAGVVAVLVLMLLSHGNRVQLATTLGATAVLSLMGLVWQRKTVRSRSQVQPLRREELRDQP
jgi:GABA permease